MLLTAITDHLLHIPCFICTN